MTTKQTPTDIALAYREVETAEKLLAEIAHALSSREAPDIRDDFWRRRSSLQLSVPSAGDARRLFDVPWTLAKPVIEAHIEHHRAVIAALSAKAAIEAAP